MNSSRLFRLILLLIAAASLWGCTGHQRLYDGPELPPDRISIIHGVVGLVPGSTTLSIMSVDGRPLSPHAQRVEVLPGKHTIGIHYHWHLAGGRVAKGEAAVDAQPGKSYRLNSTVSESGGLVSFSITEADRKK